jgi:hypothetical protein
MAMKTYWGLVGVLWAAAAPVSAVPAGASCAAANGAQTVALLELYTSEGCSSCPPADRALSRLRHDERFAAASLAALALHVDYWDSLGWVDRFAQPAFAARQRRLGGASIYTPQFFLQGRPYRWNGDPGRLADDLRKVRDAAPAARLSLRLGAVAADRLPVAVAVAVDAARRREGLALYLAVYEDGLTSRVSAGENGGSVLGHDRVVRSWLGPVTVPPAGEEARFELPLDPRWKRPDLGVTAFVEAGRSGEVLQAVSGSLCGG